MTRVSFYILDEQLDAEQWVCRLLDKAMRAGTHTQVYCPDEVALSSLDRRLWSYSQGSFTAHEIEGADKQTPAPILLSSSGPQHAQRDNILHWCVADTQPPEFFSSFSRCLEIVGGAETMRDAARARYRYYRDRGYELETHKIA